MHAQTMWMLREGTIRVDMNCDATCKQPNGTGSDLERNYASLDPWYLLNDQSFQCCFGRMIFCTCYVCGLATHAVLAAQQPQYSTCK